MEESISFGIDYTPFLSTGEGMPHSLYYGKGLLTDKYYIKYVGTESNKCWVYGTVKQGDYLTTSKWLGVAIKAPNQVVAFGVALSNHEDIGENANNEIGLITYKPVDEVLDVET